MTDHLDARTKTKVKEAGIAAFGLLIAFCGYLLAVAGVVSWFGWSAGAIMLGLMFVVIGLGVVKGELKS